MNSLGGNGMPFKLLKRPSIQIIIIAIFAFVVRIIAFNISLGIPKFHHSLYGQHTELGRNVMMGKGLKFDSNRYYIYKEAIRSDPVGWIDLNNIDVEKENLEPVYHMDMGYGILAGLIWKLFGGRINWTIVIILQIIIDSSMCFFLYAIGKYLKDNRKGLIVASLFAIFPLEIVLTLIAKYDIWVSFYYILCVFLILKEHNQQKRWMSMIIILGIALISSFTSWIRSAVVLFPFLIALYLILTKRTGFQWIKAFALILIFSLTFIIPKLLYSYKNFGQLNLTRGYKWAPFYAGLGQFKNNFGGDGTDASIEKYCISVDPQLASNNISLMYRTKRYEEILEPRVKEIIRENPLWYIGTVFKRAAIILFPGFYYHKGGIFRFLPNSNFFLILMQIILAIWSLLFLFGSYIGLRNYRWTYIALLLPYLYTLVTISPFFLQGRSMTHIYFIQFFAGIESLWYLKNKVKTITKLRVKPNV